jgi:hypothetical protein
MKYLMQSYSMVFSPCGCKGLWSSKNLKAYVGSSAITGRFCVVRQAGKKLSDKEECPNPQGGTFEGKLVTPSHEQIE